MDWFDQIDWEYWKRSSKSLSTNHPTIAREIPLEGNSEPEPMEGDTAAARSQQKEILLKLVTEIRRRDYSIRTEHAYESWVRLRGSLLFSGRPACVALLHVPFVSI